jgi:hypothetical protein
MIRPMEYLLVSCSLDWWASSSGSGWVRMAGMDRIVEDPSGKKRTGDDRPRQ